MLFSLRVWLAGCMAVGATAVLAGPRTAGGPGGVGVADGTSDLFLWLKAEALNDYADGAEITFWADGSGYLNHARDAEGGGEYRPPAARTNLYNGWTAAEFTRDDVEGTNNNYGDFLVTALDRPSDDGSESLFIVKQTRLDNLGSVGLIGYGAPGNSGGIQESDASSFQWFADGTQTSDGTGALRGVPGGSTEFQIVSGVRSTAANYIAIFTDGTLRKDNTHTDSGVSGKYHIGAASRGGPHYHNRSYDGNIAEAIVFTRMLNAAERILVENYLSAKFAHALDAGDRYAGDLPANGAFTLDVCGVGRVDAANLSTNGGAAGFAITVVNGSLGDDEWILAGHRLPANRLLADSSLPAGVSSRWERVWYVDKTGSVDAVLSFSFTDGAVPLPGGASVYSLLYRPDDASSFTDVGAAAQVNGDTVSFAVADADLQDGQYTLGTDGLPEYTVITGGTGPGGVSRPDGTTPLCLWLKPEGLGSYADGAAVTNWFDSSGWTNHAVQWLSGTSTATRVYRPPTMRAAVYNGLAAAEFTRDEYGGNQYGDFLRTLRQISTQAESLFFVNDPGSPQDPENHTRYMLGYTSQSQRGFSEASMVSIHWTVGDSVNGSGAVRGGGDAISQDLQVKSAVRSVAENFLSVYLDGKHSRTVTHTNGLLVSNIYQVGAARRGGSHAHIRSYDGHIAEIIVIATNVTDVERILIENYLNAKYMSAPLTANDYYSGDTPAKGDYDRDVFGIGRTLDGGSAVTASGAAGFGLTALSSLAPGAWALAGHRTEVNGLSDVPGLTGVQRWERVWFVDKTGQLGVRMSFNFAHAGLPAPGSARIFKLLYSAENAFDWTDMGLRPLADGDTVSFDVPDAEMRNGYYTLGFSNVGSLFSIR